MTTIAAARAAYGQGQVITADPGQLIVDCYTRIVEDLSEAVAALDDGSIEGWVTRLVHAQDIITELYKSLDIGIWDGAQTLAEVYQWALGELRRSVIHKDTAAVTTLQGMFADLRDTWAQALAGTT